MLLRNEDVGAIGEGDVTEEDSKIMVRSSVDIVCIKSHEVILVPGDEVISPERIDEGE